jgi:hypothetical protein
MNASLLITSLVCLQATSALSANYVCESEFVAGFWFDGDWIVNQGIYNLDKFLVSENDGVVTISAFGSKSAPPFFGPLACKSEPTAITCDTSYGQFRLSKLTRRYVESYVEGYWDGVDNNDNTPYVKIGSCAEM